MSLLLLIYYVAELAGGILLATRLMRRLLPLPGAPGWLYALMGIGMGPVIITWGGFSGFFQPPFIAPLVGFLLAAYTVRELIHNGPELYAKAHAALLERRNWPFLGLIIIGLLLMAYSHRCYLSGGGNNWDEQVRSFPFTTAFAANHLKPAFPLDLSIPVSYSYYYYQWSALLYASVNGYLWPSITIVPICLLAIAMFYIVLSAFAADLFPAQPRRTIALAITVLIGCVGPSIFTHPSQMLSKRYDWWGVPHQIIQISNTWDWEFHYLLGTGFCLAALMCLHRACTGDRRYLIATALNLFLALTFATLTAIFYAGIAAFMGIVLLLTRDLPWRACLRALPAIAVFGIIVLLPQYFTFFGRESYLQWRSDPVWWFTHTEFSNSNIATLVFASGKLVRGLGLPLVLGLLFIPGLIWKERRNRFNALFLITLCIAITVSLCFVRPGTFDWPWRSGLAGLVLLAAIGAVEFFRHCRESRMRRAATIMFCILFASSAPNFFIQPLYFVGKCSSPSGSFEAINRTVGLDTAIVAYDFDSKWMSYIGRVVATPQHPRWVKQQGYLLPYELLHEQFGWQGEPRPCHRSWWGNSTPGKLAFIHLTNEEFRIDYLSCEDMAGPPPPE